MKRTTAAVITALILAFSITACTKAPRDKFREICMADKDESENAGVVCSCMSEALKKQLSEDQYNQLVDFMQAKRDGKQVSEDVIDGAIMGSLFSSSISCSSVAEK